jgi:vacuolar-type H+-ATPase subunit H
VSETSIEQLKEAIKQLVDEARGDGEQDSGEAQQAAQDENEH